MRSGYKFAVLALLAGSAFFLTAASGQFNGFSNRTYGGATIHGVPPSVTSFGFGGTPGFHGVPGSVTSLNFGNAPFHASRFGGFASGPRRSGRHHHRGFINPYYGGYGYGGGYYIPYGYDYSDYGSDYSVMEPEVDDSMEENYPGPTIFDRYGRAVPRPQPRASDDYRSDLKSEPQTPQVTVPPQPVADQPDTVLVFKDGHEVEVHNYAIVGATLYDLSGGRTRKVELADLDLRATVKHNDDRGVSFQLPEGTKLN